MRALRRQRGLTLIEPLVLSAFGDRAAKSGEAERLDRMVHGGRMNLLFADGHVEARPLAEITNKSPKDIPIWTREAD